jgi:hypothetical protein
MLKEARAVKKANCPELLNALVSGKLSSKKAAAIARDEKAIEEIKGGASVEEKGRAVRTLAIGRVEKTDPTEPPEDLVETEHQKLMRRFARQMKTLERYIAESIERAQNTMERLDSLVDELSAADAIEEQ